ncbi:hypothetical protein AQUCO_07000010v1 [Aquilegia coerulea]|uniref:mitogen-activated protein kinase kinase kinase n=1 Tax=Aquilegia coerulea TaxID=218851 RepID=A0A2G5CAT2_AQUCA|nr:hypothetical protein AQUCO_07000010v1 [Aquilegia coerulea]
MEHWTRGHIIGHGSSATVSLATNNWSGEVFAVKSVELLKSEFLQREQTILSSLDCPQIVSYKGCDSKLENGKIMYNLFMEYMSGGTLADMVKRQGGSLNESAIRSYLQDILQGLDYLHSNGVVHCDIKSCNILVGEDGAKVADLGCARRVPQTDKAQRIPIAGTPMFMAPEVARGEEQSFPADIWAVGCTVIEMATGSAPWPDVTDPVSALYRIAFTTDVPEVPSFLSEQAKDFLDKCLRRDSKQRWTANQLLQHPFLNKSNSNSKLFQLSTLNSPTSILDQDFWNSTEDPKTPQNLVSNGFSNSPAARLKQLIKTSSSTIQRSANWTWGESWLTVRSNRDPEVGARILKQDMISAEKPAITSGSNNVFIIPKLVIELCPSNIVDTNSWYYLVNSVITTRSTKESASRKESFVKFYCKCLVSNIKLNKQISPLFRSNSCRNVLSILNFSLSKFNMVLNVVSSSCKYGRKCAIL